MLSQALMDRLQKYFPEFESIGSRLAVMYGGLFAVGMVLVAILTQVIITEHAQNSVQSDFEATSAVINQTWETRGKALTESADILAHDFGFRSSVASNDIATIESAVENLRSRAGVEAAYVVTQTGDVVGMNNPSIRERIKSLPFDLPEGQNSAVINNGGRSYRVNVAPILAPDEIGWVVFAEKLDGAPLKSLEGLAAIPLQAKMLHVDKQGHWRISTKDKIQAAEVDALIGASGDNAVGRTGTIQINGSNAIALAIPLKGPTGKPEAALLLSYPMSEAVASFRPLQVGLGVSGLIIFLLGIWASQRMSRGIAGPLAELDAAARALGEGNRSEVIVKSKDEVGRLAESFNRMASDILERENRITHLAFHDTLTNLPNRANFRQQLDGFVARTKKRHKQMAVLCLDIDHFKVINDSYGHPVGDQLLRTMSEILADLASDAVVSRLGGDEFAIVLPEIDDAARPRALAQSIIDRMEKPLILGDRALAVSCSIGIALTPGDGEDAETLLKNADLALYRAKQDGRGVFRFFEQELDAAVRKRRLIELDLREALGKGQFRLDFQPLWDIGAGRYGSCEALMRWDHPSRGLVSPTEFIPVAEETGMIVQMGEWAIHEACRQAATWPAHLRVAVNVSPLQFRNAGFKAIVVQALSKSGLEPNRLELELTETVFADGTKSTVELLHSLRALGVRIALDDFGTGYSSLSYLRSFPFDKIKIDKSFIDGISNSIGDQAIVKAIIDLSGALKMDVTAEGVEDQAQLDCLTKLGCSSIQGYFFSRPIRSEDVSEFVGDKAVKRAAA